MVWPEGRPPPGRVWAFVLLCTGVVGSLVATFLIHPAWLVGLFAVGCGHFAFLVGKDRKTIERVAAQLAGRAEFPAVAWGTPDRAAFAEAVGRIVAGEFGWPNAHFVPADPLVILFLPHFDGSEGLMIAYEFSKQFGRDICFGDGKTFGELVDHNIVGPPSPRPSS